MDESERAKGEALRQRLLDLYEGLSDEEFFGEEHRARIEALRVKQPIAFEHFIKPVEDTERARRLLRKPGS